VRTTSILPAMMTVLLMLVLSASAAAAAPRPEPIVVVAVDGDVSISRGGATLTVQPGTVIAPPVTILTGGDGHVELRQGATTVSIASDTRVELPATTSADGLIERVSQPRGNVVYEVAKRPGRKLRIETPYLVAVIKGTRFNVSAQDEGATVSLFEGRLEIWTPDDSDVVQLSAGEIATRGREDVRIRVLGMDTGDAIRVRNAAPVEGTNARSAGATNHDVGAEKPVDAVDDTPRDSRVVTVPSPSVDAGTSAAAVPELATTDVKADLPTIEVDRLEAEPDLDVFTKVGPTSVRVDLASPAVDVAAPADLDLGTAITTETTVGAVIEPADVQAGVGAQAEVVSTPIAVDAGVDVGGTPAIDAGVAAGPLAVDLGVGADAGTVVPTVELEVVVTEPVQPDAPLPAIVEVVVAPLRGLLGP
jgi:FecR protein